MMEVIRTIFSWMPNFSSGINTRIKTDDIVFRLHYVVTAQSLFLLTLFSVVLLVFDWVQCYSSTLHLPGKMLNVYCWMQNTFVLPQRFDGVLVGEDVAHPGVDKSTPETQRRYISYYQWIPLLFIVQGITFKAPHYLWKKHEHDEMVNLAIGYQFPIAKHLPHDKSTPDDEIHRHLNLTADYVHRRWSARRLSPWFYGLYAGLNLVNVVGNIFLLDSFFKTRFTTVGWESVRYITSYYTERSDMLMAIFPRVVKCSYYDYGVGGSVQHHDVLCLLPYNLYNEKLFVGCLLWFAIVAVLTGLDLLFWLVLFAVPPLRRLSTKIPLMFPVKSVRKLLEHVDYNEGDWFFMWMLGQNMHRVHLDKLVSLLEERLPHKTNKRQSISNTKTVNVHIETDLLRNRNNNSD